MIANSKYQITFHNYFYYTDSHENKALPPILIFNSLTAFCRYKKSEDDPAFAFPKLDF